MPSLLPLRWFWLIVLSCGIFHGVVSSLMKPTGWRIGTASCWKDSRWWTWSVISWWFHWTWTELLLTQCSCRSEFGICEGCLQSLSSTVIYLPELSVTQKWLLSSWFLHRWLVFLLSCITAECSHEIFTEMILNCLFFPFVCEYRHYDPVMLQIS